jgi:hypothetical protein
MATASAFVAFATPPAAGATLSADAERCFSGSSLLCTAVDNTSVPLNSQTFAHLEPSMTSGASGISIGNQMCNGLGQSCGTESARSDSTQTWYVDFQTSGKWCTANHTYKAFGTWTDDWGRHTSVWSPLMAPPC